MLRPSGLAVIYKLTPDALTLIRMGSHAELFDQSHAPPVAECISALLASGHLGRQMRRHHFLAAIAPPAEDA